MSSKAFAHESSQHDFDDDASENDSFDDDSSENGDHFHVECPTSADQLEKARHAFIRMVRTEEWPPRIIESPSFKKFMSTLNPFVELGDFESLKDDCLKFYEKDAIRIKHILGNMDGNINLSVETLKTVSFDSMCLTAHFIAENWKPKKWVLRFQILRESLDAAISNCLEHWGIMGKAFTLALKSNTFDAETVEKVKDSIQGKNQLQVGGKLFHVYCCAELLASMARDALDGIAEITVKLQVLIPCAESGPLWSMTNHLLKNALQLQSIGEITQDPFYKEYLLSAEEWRKVDGVSKLVDKLHTVAEVLFHAKHPNASLLLINLHGLHVSLMKQDSLNSSNFVSAVREKMLQKLDKYWQNMFLLLAVAAVMDPRCKMVYIEFLSSKDHASNGNSQSATVLEILRSLYDDYLTSTLQKLISSSDSSPSDPSDCEIGYSDSEEADKKRKLDLEESVAEEGNSNDMILNITSHLKDYQQYVQATNQPPRSELDLYLEEPVLAWDQDFKLLEWWRAQSPKYPTLSRMAGDLLSIPFLVATSYDAYYTEDRQVNTRLLSSKPALMNALKCTRSWN